MSANGGGSDGSVLRADRGPWGGGDETPDDKPKRPKPGGPKASEGEPGDSKGAGPRNPWAQPPIELRPKREGGRTPTSLDELFKKGRGRIGGGGGGGFSPIVGGRPLWLYGVSIFVVLWLFLSSFHLLEPAEEGVVTQLGSYSRTVGPGGIHMTWPAPIERIRKIDTANIRTLPIGSEQADQENLVLTGDQNIVDLAYQVRWSIKDPELFQFQLADPEQTIGEVAESSMRATVANFTLTNAIGPGRSDIEVQVQQRMQELLDQYSSGVKIDGIAIRQADPPAQVDEAFKEVNSAQQERESYQNEARAYAQQVLEQARGESAAFDKVYAQYSLAPEVTRRRMYYDTMERVLGKVDKTIVETGGVTAYLPLPELRRRARAAPGASSTPGVTVSPGGRAP